MQVTLEMTGMTRCLLLRLKKQDIKLSTDTVAFVLMLQEQTKQVVQNVQQCQANGNVAQEWEIDFNKDDSTYILKSALTGKALDMDDWSQNNGGNAIIWDNNKTNNQRWYITMVDGEYSFLINKHSNKSLEVAGWSTSNGGNVQQWDYSAQANQQWKFVLAN